jgi:2-amino-4-hydroxy-6-hydroxymethyldihydropteridine diphosphokinase
MTTAYVGLGSNLGDRARALRRAVSALHGLPDTRVETVSSVYETDPVGDPTEPAYLNAVARLRTTRAPRELLSDLMEIERTLGRGPVRRGPRPIDLDLLYHGSTRIDESGLQVPHPRAAERAFVLVPMVELDPAFVDAGTGLRMDELLRGRGAVDTVRWRSRPWNP